MICNADICNEAYKSVSSPHVFSTDVNAWFRHNDSGHELMAIADLLVAVVCYYQVHTRHKAVDNFSHNSAYGERIYQPRHYARMFRKRMQLSLFCFVFCVVRDIEVARGVFIVEWRARIWSWKDSWESLHANKRCLHAEENMSERTLLLSWEMNDANSTFGRWRQIE